MTRYFLLLATALLPLGALAQTKAKPAAPAPAASNSQFESQLATEICQDFDKQNAAKPFKQLTKDEAMNTLQQSMTQVMMKHPQELEKMMKTSGPDAAAAMNAMGQRIAGKLANDCPIAIILFTRLNDSPGAADALSSLDAEALTVTPAERPLLEKLAQDVCADLTDVTAKQPLAGMAPDQRMQLIQQSMQRVVKAHAKDISEQYGPEIFLETERLKALGAKVGSLMVSQCPKLVATFGGK